METANERSILIGPGLSLPWFAAEMSLASYSTLFGYGALFPMLKSSACLNHARAVASSSIEGVWDLSFLGTCLPSERETDYWVCIYKQLLEQVQTVVSRSFPWDPGSFCFHVS